MQQVYSPDDISVMREALDDWCSNRDIDPDSSERQRIALHILELMKGKRLTRGEIYMRLLRDESKMH